MKKKVYIIYTGGTIGMKPTEDGYAPAKGFLREQMEAMPELKHDDMPEYFIHEYDPLLDSANMTPDNWMDIAMDIYNNYYEYDGFVVLHGTDTMAYTASALAFMLEGLAKPVVITGSQIPLYEIRSDGRVNLITAMQIAANYKIPEVCLYFGDKLLRGCRSVKFSADRLHAFTSPNFPPLGTVGIDIKINWDLVLPFPNRDFKVQRLRQHNIGYLRFFPGISAAVVENMLRIPLEGLILETYGLGNGPDKDKELMEVIKNAVDRGVVIVACTQCVHGIVNLREYAAGMALAKAGVVSGYDMTGEAALAKMLYLFSKGFSSGEVRDMMQRNLRGELTSLLQ